MHWVKGIDIVPGRDKMECFAVHMLIGFRDDQKILYKQS